MANEFDVSCDVQGCGIRNTRIVPTNPTEIQITLTVIWQRLRLIQRGCLFRIAAFVATASKVLKNRDGVQKISRGLGFSKDGRRR